MEGNSENGQMGGLGWVDRFFGQEAWKVATAMTLAGAVIVSAGSSLMERRADKRAEGETSSLEACLETTTQQTGIEAGKAIVDISVFGPDAIGGCVLASPDGVSWWRVMQR